MDQSPLRVLFLDDETRLREPLEKYLTRQYGYQVTGVKDRDTALAALENAQGRFDVALVDEVLGDGPSGFEVLQLIKNRYPNIEVILFTGWGMEHALDALRAGAFRYLAKPFHPDELAMFIRLAAEFRQLKGAAREKAVLEQLLETSAVLLGGQSEQPTLERILKGIQAIGFDRVRLYQILPEEGALQGKAQVGMEQDFAGVSWPVESDPYMRQVLAAPRPYVFKRQPGEILHMEIVLGKEDVDEWACVPLILEGRVVGKLSADNKYSHRPIVEAELGPIAIFASQAAVTIENARLFQETRQRLDELESLRRTTLAITSALDRQALLGVIIQQAVGLLKARSGGIYDYDPDGEQLVLVADFGRPQSVVGRTLKVGEGLAGRLIASDEPYLAVPDYARWDGRSNKYVESEFRSVIEVPLTWQERRIGILFVEDIEGRRFSKDEAHLLGLFADQAAIALANASALAALGATRDRLDRLVASSFDGIVTVNLRGEIEEINATAEKILGYCREELSGKTIANIYYDRREPRRIWKLIWGNPARRLPDYETCLLSKSGERIPVRLSATFLFDAQGRRIGSAGFFKDLRLIQETENQRKLLLEAGEAVARADNLDQGLQSLAEKMVASCPATFCAIFLLAPNQPGLVAKAAYPIPRATGLHWNPRLGKVSRPFLHPDLDFEEDSPRQLILRRGFPPDDAILDHLAEEFSLAGSLSAALMIPLEAGQEIQGLCILGEMRAWERRPFSGRQMELACSLASHAAVLIEKMRLHEQTRQKLAETERHNHLLAALDQALRNIRAERETSQLWHEIASVAADLASCGSACLLFHWPLIDQLEVAAVRGLPDRLVGARLSYDHGLLGLVAHLGQAHYVNQYRSSELEDRFFAAYHFQSAAAIPLRQAGEVEAILFVADERSGEKFTLADREVLDRFALQASLVLRTSRLINREQRMYAQLALLQRISQYIIQTGQALNKIFHVVLTGVTAGYGLGFNRAALLLLDESGKYLEGNLGIGCMDLQSAHQDWEESLRLGLDDFGRYLDLLEQDRLEPTPLDRRVRGLRLPLHRDGKDLFSQAVQEARSQHVLPDRLEYLPENFRQAFEPDGSFVIVPLAAQEQVIGLLVADNKFTHSPVTDETLNMLMTFANTAAIAIANHRLLESTRAAHAGLHELYKATSALISAQNPRRVLRDVVKQTQRVFNAAWVSLLLIDDWGNIRDVIDYGIQERVDQLTLIRPNGISMQVLRSGKPEVIGDVLQCQGRLNPILDFYEMKAVCCLPVRLRGKSIGVMWVHYRQPHFFPEYEIDGLQLYVNQAAIAYENSRRMDRLELLHKAAEKISGFTGLKDVLKQIVHSAREIMQAESVAILGYDSRTRRFLPDASQSMGLPVRVWKEFQKDAPRPGGTAFTILEHGWIGVEDLVDQKRYPFLGSSTRQLLEKIGVHAFQGIPLRVGAEKLGVLYANYSRPQVFSQEERETTRTLANLAALSLKKAVLLEQMKKSRRAAEVVARVMALGEARDTLESIARGTQEATGCDAVVLYVYDQASGKLEHPPTMVGVRYPEEATKLDEVKLDSIVYTMLNCGKPYYVVEKNSEDPYFRDRRFTREEEIESCVAVPLVASGQSQGVMFVNYRTPRRFSEEELASIQLFAHQAAVAIRNLQLFARVQKNAAVLQALYEAGKAVSSSLDLERILTTLVQQARRLSATHGFQASYSLLALKEGAQLKFMAADPPHFLKTLTERIGGIDLENSARVGITGRAVLDRRPLLLGDVSRHPDYINFDPDTRSELSVPIFAGNEVIGAINVEHTERDAFDEQDVQALVSLAAQAGVAIQNARLYQQETERLAELQRAYQELEQARGLANARTSLAWMGMVTTTWRHAIGNYTTVIQDLARLAKEELQDGAPVDVIRQRLERIGQMAEKIHGAPITAPLQEEEGERSVALNELLRERIKQLWKKEAYLNVELVQNYQLSDSVTVRASPHWLRRAVEYLVENAIDAMAGRPVRRLTLTTRLVNGRAEIIVCDTGRGVPDDIRPHLFRKRVDKPTGTRGLGISLLIVHTIVQTYGGDAELLASGPTGTQMLIWLPAEQAELNGIDGSGPLTYSSSPDSGLHQAGDGVGG